MPSNVLVSGLTEANGIYTFNFVNNDKPSYLLEREEGAYTIRWNGIMWLIGPDGGDSYYYSTEDVEFPWLVNLWLGDVPAGNPIPTLTEDIPSSQPTFGLPTDVVALITSRFGTVANFLRLRNLGQV